jgi:hypothetical protein
MNKDYSNKNLRKASFKDENLSDASFSKTDLRGADFTNANLTGADLTNIRTGITPMNTVLIFLAAFAISMLSGYVAMLAGQTVQMMLASPHKNIMVSGWVAGITIILFVVYALWKGVRSAMRHLIIPVVVMCVFIGTVALVTGLGSGLGIFYIILSFLLVVVMFVVGTISRAAAGVLSDIMFTAVALAGGVFGKSLGGGIGTVVMALGCMAISKRALSGAKGFESLRKLATLITKRFGTSFRNSKLTNANFSGSKLHNTDFSNADLSSVNWGDATTINSISAEDTFIKKEKHHG